MKINQQKKYKFLLLLMSVLFCIPIPRSIAQDALLPVGIWTDWTNPTFSTLSISSSLNGGTINNLTNITNTNTGDYAQVNTSGVPANEGISFTLNSSVKYSGNKLFKLNTAGTGDIRSFIISYSKDFGVTYDTLNNVVDVRTDGSNPLTTQNNRTHEIKAYLLDSFTNITVTMIRTSLTGNLRVYNAQLKNVDYEPSTVGTCNTITPLTATNLGTGNVSIVEEHTGRLGGFTVGTVTSQNDVLNSNDLNYANITPVLGVNSKLGLGVKYDGVPFASGTFLGFKLEFLSSLTLAAASNLELVTYLDGVEIERVKASSSVVSANLLTPMAIQNIGFNITYPADEIALEANYPAALSLGTIRVYNAVFNRLCDVNPFVCNTMTKLTQSQYPVYVDKDNSGLLSVGLLGSSEAFTDLNHLLDDYDTTYVSINSGLTLTAAQVASISVKKALTPFPAGYFAGFDIGSSSVLDLTLLGNSARVMTFLNGVEQERSSNSNLISLNTALLTSGTRQIVGFRTTKPFDEIRYEIVNTAGVNALVDTRIYGAYVEQFCAGPDISCTATQYANQLVALRSPEFPMYVDGRNTGVSSTANAGAGITNPNFAIDADTSNYTTIDATLLVAGNLTYTVADAITNYPANTYIAFDITVDRLLDLQALGGMELRLVKDGELLPRVYTPTLLLGASVLNATEQRYKLGLVSADSFDGIQLTVGGVANIGALGDIKIHGVYMQALCATTIGCNENISLKQGSAPVVINNERTGPSGLATASLFTSAIGNIDNIIDADPLNYTTITGNVSAGTATSISVWNPIQTYPAGSNAGYVVEVGPSLLTVGLLDFITIITYNNGVEQERSTNAYLLDVDVLTLNLLGAPSTARFVGFRTSKPYDEIVIRMADVLSGGLDIDGTKIYGAYVNTNGVQLIDGNLCSNILPDVNVAIKNQVANGSLSTNDVFAGSPTVLYGTQTIYTDTLNNDPNRVATLILNSDGTYTVSATDTGVYEFNIPVTINDGVPVYSTLKVTVIDVTTDINPIIANDDIAYMTGGATPSTLPINVLANDAAGNSTRLLTVTNATAASGATTSILSNGTINYTPAPGFYGIDTVYYTVADNTPNGVQTSTAKAVIYVYEPGEVQSVNMTVASDDYVEVNSSTPINVSAANGVLANDTLIGTGNLIVTSTTDIFIDPTNPNVGTVRFNADGSYTVTPGSAMIASKSYPVVYNLSNGSGATSNGTLYVMGLFNDPLPIRLVDFGAKMIDCNTANVTWKTASENHVSHFEVEYSTTGNHFLTVAQVAAVGESTGGASYQKAVMQNDQIGFYRLKVVDEDGTTAYSKIVQLQMTNCNTAGYSIAPNPSTGKFTVRGEAIQGKIQVMDITGKVMYDAIHDSLLQTEIDITAYPTGTYHLRIITENGKAEVFKLIKY